MEVRSLLGKTAGEGRTGVVEKALGKQRSCSAPEGCGLENPEGRGGVWEREADGATGGPRRWPWWEADLGQPLTGLTA